MIDKDLMQDFMHAAQVVKESIAPSMSDEKAAEDSIHQFASAEKEKRHSLELLNLSYEELLDRAASSESWAAFLETSLDQFMKLAERQEEIIQLHGRALDAALAGLRDVPVLIDEVGHGVAVARKNIVAAIAAVPKKFAKSGALARLEKDSNGKQAAKAKAFDWWGKWQINPDMYPGPTAYATSMMDKLPALTNHASIMNWHRAWKKEPYEIRGSLVVKRKPSI